MKRSTIIFLNLIVFDLNAQDHFNYLSSRISYGSILLHSEDLRAIEDSYPIGIEFDLGKHRTSQKVWANCNCYPKTGVSLSIWDFDNPDVLGYGATALYYVQPVFGARRKFNFSLRAAAGVSFQSKPYDEESNPDNLSYSTYFGVPLQLGFAAHFKLSDQWMIDLNTVFNHIYNGGLKEPNKGINWPTIGLGVSRYFNSPEFPNRTKNNWKEEDIKLDRFDLTAFATYSTPSPRVYLISYGLEIKYARRISHLSNITEGSEWLYDNGQANKSNEELSVDGNHLGMAVGHEFILGRFLFGQQFGVYLLQSKTRLEDVYQRYSLVYRIHEKISGGISLKTHGHVADFADLRTGYSF